MKDKQQLSLYSRVFITGASSGIGASLAEECSRRGSSLILLARNELRLNTVKENCLRNGAKNVTVYAADVRNEKLMKEIIEKECSIQPFSLSFANAGISKSTRLFSGNYTATKEIWDTNLIGILNTIHPLIPLLDRTGGTLCIMSSMASFVPLPHNPAYSASKAAIRFYAEALSGSAIKENSKIRICSISPGYVKTPLTDNNTYKMPLLITATKAAEIILKKIEKGKIRITFPLSLYLVTRLIDLLPYKLSQFILNSFKAEKKPEIDK